MKFRLFAGCAALLASIFGTTAMAQMMRPPPFMGGVPGMNQVRALEMQRHQARTLLYREALEELRKNPKAADVPDCAPGQTPTDAGKPLCLAQAAPTPTAPAAAVPSAPTLPPPTRRRIAVLFGNNGYTKPIPALETPIFDVTAIASVLQARFGFETQIVKDAGKATMIETLNRIAADVTPEDSVLLFYAGHGYLMEDIKMGYWIPVDASVKTAKGWISNSDISKLLAAIRARQLILVSDSCYSGTLTHEQQVNDQAEVRPENVYANRSVLALSSGGDEPVSDEGKDGHSIFAWSLIKALEEVKGVTPGSRVWRKVHTTVTKDFEQKPQYGAVVSAGHAKGGEFLFLTELTPPKP